MARAVGNYAVDSIYAANNMINETLIFPALDVLSLPDKAIDWATNTTSDERMAWAASSPLPADDVGLGIVAALGKLPKVARTITTGRAISNSVTSKAYQGVKEASVYLQQQNVPRKFRKQILESFDRKSMIVRSAGTNEYGLRYFDDVNAFSDGRYTFETFPASRSSLGLDKEWNEMTKLKQWKIKQGTTILEGPASSQGIGLDGGQIQKYILNPENYVEP